MNKLAIKAGLISFAAVLGLSEAHRADAAYRRIHSSSCHVWSENVTNNPSPAPNFVVSINSSDIVNDGTLNDQARTVYCPFPSDGYLSHANVVTINVHGWEPDGKSVTSKACTSTYNLSGSICGTTKNWGGLHSGGLSVDPSAWNDNSSGFPYVVTALPHEGRYYGMYVTD